MKKYLLVNTLYVAVLTLLSLLVHAQDNIANVNVNNRVYRYDLSHSGKLNKIDVTEINGSLHLIINSFDVDLDSSEIGHVYDQNNKPREILFIQLTEYKATLIAIAVQDDVIFNKSHLKLFLYKDNTLTALKLYTDDTTSYDELISVTGISFIDTTSGTIYVPTMNNIYSTLTGEELLYRKISIYRWNKKLNRMILIGDVYSDSKNISISALKKIL